MKFILFVIVFFHIILIQAQNIYEENKEVLENCFACKRKIEIKEVDQSLVDKDIRVFREMINPIAEIKPILPDYQEIYSGLLNDTEVSSNHTINLLDDLKYVSYDFYGGYTDFSLKLLVHGDNILYTRLWIEVTKNLFQDRYLKEIDIPLSCSASNMEYYKTFANNITEYKKKYPYFNLDIDINAFTNEELNVYYNLNHVEENMDTFWVSKEYADFSISQVKNLLKDEKYTIFEKLIFGVNPVARIYAYAALKIAQDGGYQINNQIKKQFQKIEVDGLSFKIDLNSGSQTIGLQGVCKYLNAR